ncbi:MAG: bifunctional oligoribonuclease/PAP phosphatase NrnA [Spirochaetes bacterium]|nr:bifunctional oligoribonuclease/PAP phosphatase NrnA [Spirochaetota bacterium]
MSKKGNKNAVWKMFKESHVIVLTTHVRPDGDGIASELALYFILSSMGKVVYIINQDRTPDIYSWLPDADRIITLEENDSIQLPAIDLTVLLDCSSSNRIGRVYDLFKDSKKIISLDHHEDSECFRDYCYIDPGVSSIGELLYTLIPDIKCYIDKKLATYIYVSIMTDTGSFAYANTTKKVFQIVSHLLGYGVSPDHIFQMVYNNKSINHFRLLGKALELLETDDTGQIAHVLLPLSVYRETGATKEDNEGILEVIRGFKNVELIIMLRQLKSKRLKGSLRSSNKINCNHLSKMFGGGGHFKASGFTIEGDVNEIGSSIIQKICDEVKELGWI